LRQTSDPKAKTKGKKRQDENGKRKAFGSTSEDDKLTIKGIEEEHESM